jgi:hypothetical protein
VTNRVGRKGSKDSAEITIIISDDNFANQIPFPSLNLSSRCSSLSRTLSPDRANESAGFCLGGPLPVPCESATVSMLFIFGIMQILVACNKATCQDVATVFVLAPLSRLLRVLGRKLLRLAPMRNGVEFGLTTGESRQSRRGKI